MKLNQTLLRPVLVTALTVTILGISGGYFAWIVTTDNATEFFGKPLIQLFFWTAWLIPAVAVICGVMPALIKINSKAFLCWLTAALICYLCVDGYHIAINECDVSYSVSNVKRRLLPEEVKSIRSNRKICPTAFTYVSHETRKVVNVFGAQDFIHGTKIWVDERRF